MNKDEIKEFRMMALHIVSKELTGHNVQGDIMCIEDYLMQHGARSADEASIAWRVEAQRQQVSLEYEYEALSFMAVAAFFANGCDHTAPDVQTAIRKAEAAGKLIGKDRDDVERDIAEECEARE